MNGNKQKLILRSLSLIICVFLISTSFFSAASSFSPDPHALPQSGETSEGTGSGTITRLQYSFTFMEPDLKQIELYDEVFTGLDVPGTFSIGSKPGTPVYQVLPTKILIPSGKRVIDIKVIPNSLLEVSPQIDLIQQPIIPYQPAIPVGMPTPDSIIFDEDIYQTSQGFPMDLYESLGVHQCRGYSILTLNIYPTKYNPSQGKLWYFDEIIIDISLEDETSSNNMYRDSFMDKQWVENLVINPKDLETYSSRSGGSLEYPGGLCNPSEDYDYVIITRSFLTDFTATYNWDDFIGKKQSEGIDAIIVSVEDITACSSYWNSTTLFNDTAANIREFLRDAYEDWGIQYVLIAGDQEGSAAIPRRLMTSSVESNVEADIYWSNLDNTFNADQDSSWGEEGDNGFDLYSELFIGSLTCDEGDDLSNWMTKSFYYADSLEKDYLENAAFYGGDLDGIYTWYAEGDDFMDFTLYGTDNWLGPDPEHDGPWPSWLGFLYGFDTWNTSNPGNEFNTSVRWTGEGDDPEDDGPNLGWQGGSESAAILGLKNKINSNEVTLLNGIAHANSDMSLDVYSSSWESDYNNTKPFFIHDCGCHCGDMDASDDGVLHSMLFHSDTELAFAAIYNTGYGWGNRHCTNSSSALQQKLFWDYMFNTSKSGGSVNWQLGKAQGFAKDAIAPTINWGGSWRENIQCSILFGDPAQLLKRPFTPEHDIMVTDLDVDDVVAYGETQTVSATVRNVGNNTETGIVVDFKVNGSIVDNTIIASLNKMESTIVSFNWDPAIGAYLAAIESRPIPAEYDLLNNNVNKTVHVIPAPAINVSPSSFSFMVPTNATDTDTLVIENLISAEAVLEFNISFSGDLGGSWLSAAPVSDTVDIGSSKNVIITVNTTDLTEGTYQGYVIVESNDLDDPEVIVPVDLTVVYGNDMAVTTVNSPTGTVTYGNHIINATVQNMGYYDQTNVLVNCTVFEGGIAGTIIDEDFSSEPTDWTITHTSGTAWTWDSTDERMEHTYGYPNAGYLDSPIIDCSERAGITFSFWHYWKADYSSQTQDGYVRGSIDGGATYPFVIDEFHHNDPAEETAVKTYDLSWADNRPNVRIRFDIYNDNDYYWRIDDFNVTAEYSGDVSYSAETTVNVPAYESRFVEFTPAWDTAAGNYSIMISTLLDGDQNPTNDKVTDMVIVTGPQLSFDPSFVDVGELVQGETTSTSFDVWNNGPGVLDYILSPSESWLSISPDSGSCEGDELDTITVTVDTAGLSIGSHTGEVLVSSNGGGGTFTVDVTVNAAGSEEIDQQQTLYTSSFYVGGSRWAAQSFIPTLDTLTKIKLFIGKYSSPGDAVVSIHTDGPGGTEISSLIVPAGSIPAGQSWFEFDIPDVTVTPSSTYAIVINSVGGSGYYLVGYGSDNPYANGMMYLSGDNGGSWKSYSSLDLCFETYGISGPPNIPPTAMDDTYGTSEDAIINIAAPGVLGNDTDPDSGPQPLSAVLESDVSDGTLTLNSDGSFDYIPDADFFGSDSFTYRAYDGQDYSNVAMVIITVSSVNDQPVAVDDTALTAMETPVVIDVVSNDYDIDGSIVASTVSIVDPVGHGSTSVNPVSGEVTYTPASGYTGPDSFKYTVDDNESATSNEATVSITVVGGEEIDQQQTSHSGNFYVGGSRWAAQSFIPTLDTLTKIKLFIGKYSSPGDAVVSIHTDGPGGTEISSLIVPAGSIPAGQSWFEFDIPDVTVTPSSTYAIVINSVGGSGYYLVGYGSDNPYANGMMYLSGDNGGSWKSYSSLDLCFETYGISGPPNIPPTAMDNTYGTSEDAIINIAAPGVLGNDTDPDSGPSGLSAYLEDDVSNGDLTFNSDGSFDYIPDADFFGSDSFTYRAYDGQDYSNVAMVIITVSSVNDQPVAVDDTALTAMETPVVIDVVSNDYDIDGSIVASTVSIVDPVGHGSTSVNPVSGEVTYTPASGYTGPDSFKYTVDDNESATSNEATVSITVVGGEEIDQQQTSHSGNFYVGGSRWAAQSFIPTLDTLTKIKLFIGKYSSPGDAVVSIHTDGPGGTEISSLIVPAGSIPAGQSWFEFDIPDVTVTPSSTYAIVINSVGGSGYYLVGYGSDNPYANGMMYLSGDNGGSWKSYSSLDLCFETYGIL